MDAVVRTHFDAKISLQAVSLSPDEKYAALACRTHVQIVQLGNFRDQKPTSESDPQAISPLLRLQQSRQTGSSNFTITDVAWSSLNADRIASSATNGAVVVFNLHPAGSPTSPSPPQSHLTTTTTASQGSSKGLGQKIYSGSHVEWEAGGDLSSRAVNRIHWHPSERDTLLSANQDGFVRIFDTRANKEAASKSLNAHADACRDAQFNPFYDHILAAIYENGSVVIWDRRMAEQALLRLPAHTESGLALDWNPSQAWLLATGSRDKTVKVWDLTQIPAIASFALLADSSVSTGTSTIKKNTNNRSRMASRNSSLAFSRDSPMQGQSFGAAGVESVRGGSGVVGGGTSAKHKPKHTLHTSSIVSRVSWRPVRLAASIPESVPPPSRTGKPLEAFFPTSTAGPRSLRDTTSSQESVHLASTSTERGEISVWDISKSSNLPACVIRGHSEGCTGFSWLQTLSHLDPFSPTPHPLLHSSTLPQVSSTLTKTPRSNPTPATLHASKSTPALTHSSIQHTLPFSNKNQSRNLENSPTTGHMTGPHAEEDELYTTGIFQHLLTIGKEGAVLVQDLRNAYFPGEHISRHVVAFSAMGHLAYQRGNVVRGDPLSLVANSITQHAPGWFRDQPSFFGVKVGENNTVSEDARSDDLMHHIQAGVITIGMSDFSHLAASRDTMGTGAEGGAFDPTVIRHLADSYMYDCDPCPASVLAPVYPHDRDQKTMTHMVLRAIRACQNNGQAAAAVGLAGHAATWSALESLIPSLANITSADSPSPDAMLASHDSSYSWELLFTMKTTGDLLVDMLDAGDCQHFVALCEVIRAIDSGQTLNRVTKNVLSELRIREGYMSYLDTLNRLCLFSHANALIRPSTDRYISQLSKQGVIIRACCAKCGKEVGDNEILSAVGAVWCNKCKRCVGLCALCQKPVTRMLQWCPICGHGGHSSCLQQWFSSHLTCPSGCGHRCSMKCRVGRTGVGQEARGKEEVEVRSDKEGRCCTQSCPRRTKNQISSWAISRVGGK